MSIQEYPVKHYLQNQSLITIRNVELKDLESLEWDGEYRHFRRTYRDTYQRALTGSTVMWMMCYGADLTIGQLFVQLVSSNTTLADGKYRAYIFSFRIRKEYRSQGLGSLLLTHAEDHLLQNGYKTISLNVAQTNFKALKLYERKGYHVVGPDPGKWSYQTDDGGWVHMEEPAWRLEKQLVLV